MKKREIKYESELNLSGFKLPCYVLADGTRVLSGRGMQDALKVAGEADNDREQQPGNRLRQILNQKAVKFLIDKEKELEKKHDRFDPIICYKGGQKIHGYEATTLVDICKIFLAARKSAKEKGHSLSTSLEIVANQSEILLGAFAKVGIIALIDEATGYQYERERFELQKILKAFISEKILEWKQTFPLSYYKELFRLWNIPFTAENIKRKPQFIGWLTNELVYKNLPRGEDILEKLKKKTPKTKGGHYKKRFHQSLTRRVGREALKKVIHEVEVLAWTSHQDKNKFLRLVKERFHPEQDFPYIDVEAMDERGKQSKFDKALSTLTKMPPIKD